MVKVEEAQQLDLKSMPTFRDKPRIVNQEEEEQQVKEWPLKVAYKDIVPKQKK